MSRCCLDEGEGTSVVADVDELIEDIGCVEFIVEILADGFGLEDLDGTRPIQFTLVHVDIITMIIC